MPKWGYSIVVDELDPEKTAKASGREVRVSHKLTREVCKAIKGMMLSDARMFLRGVIEKKRPVPLRRFNKKAGHRHGLDGVHAGRYPVKAARKVLDVIENAAANAENKGLDTDNLYVMHAASYPGMKIKRYMPRAHGRASPKFETLTHIEIVLAEKALRGNV